MNEIKTDAEMLYNIYLSDDDDFTKQIKIRDRFVRLTKQFSSLCFCCVYNISIVSKSRPYFQIGDHQFTMLDEVEKAINLKAFL